MKLHDRRLNKNRKTKDTSDLKIINLQNKMKTIFNSKVRKAYSRFFEFRLYFDVDVHPLPKL